MVLEEIFCPDPDGRCLCCPQGMSPDESMSGVEVVCAVTVEEEWNRQG